MRYDPNVIRSVTVFVTDAVQCRGPTMNATAAYHERNPKNGARFGDVYV